jgi:thiamine-phosphate pyrophosphorylase
MIFPPLYAVVDQVTAKHHGWNLPDLARSYLAGGARLIQVRVNDNDSESAQLLAWCEEIVSAANPYGAKVIINNRTDIALLSGATGVHIGQRDLSVTAVRRLVSPSTIVGLSTHTVSELEQSAHEDLSYVAVGPVFKTPTKQTAYSTVGLKLVRHASKLQPLRPVVAIGGITLSRAPDVLSSGATSVAVISDLLVGGDPERRVRDYIKLLEPLAK